MSTAEDLHALIDASAQLAAADILAIPDDDPQKRARTEERIRLALIVMWVEAKGEPARYHWKDK